MLTDTMKKLECFVELLRSSAGLDLTATIHVEDGSDGPDGNGTTGIRVELGGNDVSLLTDANGELLDAIEQIAEDLLRLDADGLDPEGNRVEFDANNFRAQRAREVRQMADFAISEVRCSSLPYRFAPMSFHDRRLLHRAFASSGFTSISTGGGSRRAVVLYPGILLQREPGAARRSSAEML
jgi:spoIIIJ-associated protein